MVALATDKLLKVGNPGSATTLSAPGYTIADTAITVGSTSNWSTDTGVVFAIDEAEVVDGQEIQVAGTYNEYIGVVTSGTSVTSVAWQTGVGDRNYASGALTRVYIPVSAERENRIVTWGTAQHNQDGTHGAVTATSVTASGTVQGATVVATGDSQLRSVSLETIHSEMLGDYVSSGLIWSLSSGLVGTMTSGIAYIGGKRLVVSAIATRTYTASKDTYVSLDNTGTFTYSEVANNAASPSLPANSVWVAKVVTSGAAITSVLSYTSKTAFSMYRSAAQAFVASTLTKVQFDAIEFDDGNNARVDTTNLGKFIAPRAGNYFVTATVTDTGLAVTRLFTTLFKNGVEIKRGADISASALGSTVSATLKLAANDYIEVYYFVNAAGGTLAGQTLTHFSGYKV